MLWVLKIGLIVIAPSALLYLLFSYKYKKKYNKAYELAKKYNIDITDILENPYLWNINNTLIMMILYLLTISLLILCQKGINQNSNITGDNLISGEYNIASVIINRENYELLKNSKEIILPLENEMLIKWSEHKNCEITIKRKENLKEPYVVIDVERVGNFWKDAVLDVYGVSNMNVYLSEDSKIFDYSGIENYMDVNSDYH